MVKHLPSLFISPPVKSQDHKASVYQPRGCWSDLIWSDWLFESSFSLVSWSEPNPTLCADSAFLLSFFKYFYLSSHPPQTTLVFCVCVWFAVKMQTSAAAAAAATSPTLTLALLSLFLSLDGFCAHGSETNHGLRQSGSTEEGQKKKQPHIIFILTDDQVGLWNTFFNYKITKGSS